MATGWDIKGLIILIVGAAAAVSAMAYAHGGIAAGLGAIVSYEPTTILLSGSLLIGLGGALRRFQE